MEYTAWPKREAQAAISQQPLFAPQNEALQDNEHFKTATPTTPTTRLSQHSDIGEGGEGGWERESQLDLSKPDIVFSGADEIYPSETTLIKQHNTLFPLIV